MKKEANIKALILSGGKSSRMGTEKGMVELMGKSFVSHLIDTVRNVTDSITLIANNECYSSFGLQVIPDIIQNKGPLAGIYTGLMESPYERNLFLSCDIPLINTETILYLIQASENCKGPAVILHNGKTEPLCGIYRKEQTRIIHELLLKNELSVMHALEQMNTLYVDISKESFYQPEIFMNINTKQELESLEKRLQWKK